jgi:ubiquinone/menaquinone biosynthesis C-methylase UbiE
MTVTPRNPAETYESFMVPALFAPCARLLIDEASPKPGDRVLDVACGTGIVARHVAALHDGRALVTGIDVSPGMLDVARDRAASEGRAIEWVEGPAEDLPFPDGAFDLVTCQFGLMFFTDRRAALAEMHRVLAPGGRLAIHVFQEIGRHPFYVRLDDAIRARFGLSGVGAIFALGNADELRDQIAEAGFGRIAITPHDLTARFPDPDAFLAGEIAVDTASIPEMQRLDTSARTTMVEGIAADIREPLAAVTDGDVVAMPFHTLIALGIR